ncbi:hypothetical protein [Algicola sagamiensis]|uniref:hypothetical protein n=1 Tax=Algicola sagamiensis TaxID=163869 RepID=UPI00037832B3|nr:hypothetical protein [Algicola sagamiensis]
MKNTAENIDSISKLHEEYQASPTFDVTDIHAGFSKRFNEMIDLSNIDVPLGNGRAAYLHKLWGYSKPSIGDWINKNKPPKDTNLVKIVTFFLNHIPTKYDILPERVVSWLKFGPSVCPNPFDKAMDSDPIEQKVIPLAMEVIATETKRLEIRPSSYDLDQVLSYATKILADFEVYDMDSIMEAHRKVIRAKIQQSAH